MASRELEAAEANLRQELDDTQKLLRHYDAQRIRGGSRRWTVGKLPHVAGESVPEYDEAWEAKLLSRVDSLKEQLQQLYLSGDHRFRVISQNKYKLLILTSQSKFIICDIRRSATPPSPPQDMDSLCYYSLNALEDEDLETKSTLVSYEEIRGERLYDIDQLQKIYPLAESRSSQAVSGDLCKFVIEWKNPKKYNKPIKQILYVADYSVLEEVVGAHLRQYNQSKVNQIQRLKELIKLKNTHYDPNSSSHVSLLSRLWKQCFPDQAFQPVSDEWKRIGFQGKSPATDFRGMGLLGLHNLVYFAESYSDQVHRLVQSEREYPLASVGINVTSTLLECLGLLGTKLQIERLSVSSPQWNTDLMFFLCGSASERGFEEVYCSYMQLLDGIWMEVKATYMDFPKVSQMVKQRFLSILKRRPVGVTQLRMWVQQEVLLAATLDNNQELYDLHRTDSLALEERERGKEHESANASSAASTPSPYRTKIVGVHKAGGVPTQPKASPSSSTTITLGNSRPSTSPSNTPHSCSKFHPPPVPSNKPPPPPLGKPSS